MTDHRRSRSVSVDRLSQELPPLPDAADTSSLPTPYRDDPEQVPYRDEPEQQPQQPVDDGRVEGEGEGEAVTPGDQDSPPPEYQPMYDYLRSKTPEVPEAYGSSPPALCITIESEPQAPYRDGPAAEPSDEQEPPPPSYHDVYRDRDIELGNLERELGMAGSMDLRERKEQAEDIFKWLVAMLIIILTIAAVGTAFNWGRGY